MSLAIKRLKSRGFTLVELMIVVAIIGVLAALAIYGVTKYLRTAKSAEARNSLGGISRAAVAAYERETVASEVVPEGQKSSASNHALCNNTANPVPQDIANVKGVKYQPNSAEGQDYQTGDSLAGWKCLRFQITSPQYYQYNYVRGASQIAKGAAASTANGFEAWAKGDVDADDTLALFAATGEVNTATGSVRASSQLFVENETE